MPDIEMNHATPAAGKGIGGRLRSLFTRNEPAQGTPATPEGRLKELQRQANDTAPLTGPGTARKALWVSMPDINRRETLAIITAAKGRQAAHDFIDDMNETGEAMIVLPGEVKIFGKSSDALQRSEAEHEIEPGSANAGRGGEYRELLQFNHTHKNVEVAYGLLRSAGLDPQKTVAFRNINDHISMEDLTPKEKANATSVGRLQPAMTDEEIDAAVEHDMEIFNSPREAESPDIEAAVKHDLEIFQDLQTGAEDQQAPNVSTRTSDTAKTPSERDRIEALLKGKADADDLDRFEKQLKAIKFAQITVVSGHTVRANRANKDAEIQYQVRPGNHE